MEKNRKEIEKDCGNFNLVEKNAEIQDLPFQTQNAEFQFNRAFPSDSPENKKK